MHETFADVVILDDEASTLTLRDIRKIGDDDANMCRAALAAALAAAGEPSVLDDPTRWGDELTSIAVVAIEQLKADPDPMKPAPAPTIVGSVALYDIEYDHTHIDHDEHEGNITVDFVVACALAEHVASVAAAVPGLQLVLDRIGGPPPSPEPPVAVVVSVRG